MFIASQGPQFGGVGAFRVVSASEQVAAHLRNELLEGRWKDVMPGEGHLIEVLGVGRNTVKAALKHLEEEGLLESRGAGRQRAIVRPDKGRRRAIRVGIVPFTGGEERDPNISMVRQLLSQAGHETFFASRSVQDLDAETPPADRPAEDTEVDAWIVCAGSHKVLARFLDRAAPTFALFGGASRLDIASTGPDKLPAIIEGARRMLDLGHERIVMITRKDRIVPKPALQQQAVLDEMEARGVPTGPPNLPLWENDAEDFRRCLDSVFDRREPPTALIFDESELFIAARHQLERRGVLTPNHVSMMCGQPDPSFDWSEPSTAHIRYDMRPVYRRVVQWVDNIAEGKEDRRKEFHKARFVDGATIGPVLRGV